MKSVWKMRPSKNALFALSPALIYMAAMAVILRRCLMDDAYIGLRFLDNLLSGNGLVFNPSEKVEGITNIGWIIFIAPFSFIMQIPIAAKAVGAALAAVTVILCWLIALRLNEGKNGWYYVLPVPLLVAGQFDFLYFSLAGMETALLSAILCLALWLVMIDRYRILTGFLCAFAFTVHPESALVFPVYVLLILALKRESLKECLVPGLAFVSFITAFTMLRYLYYGDLLPHTFQAKPAGWKEIIKAMWVVSRGWNTNLTPPYNNLIAFIVMACGGLLLYKKLPRAVAFMAATVVAGLLFCIYAPQDWTFMGRYFAPYLPVAVILFWRGLVEIHERLLKNLIGGRKLNLLIAAYASLIIGLGLFDAAYLLRQGNRERYPGYVIFAERLVGPSLWVRDNVPDDAVVATRRIGALGYYSKKRIFDYKFGLVDREIAALKKKAGTEFRSPDHPALAEIWPRVSPDYVLEDSPVIEAVVARSGRSMEEFEIHGISYRVIKSFRIGADVDWTLCEKIK
jgi:hypothetical protein